MKFVWPESARSELRAIDRETAVRILRALTRYGDSGDGDVKALAGQWQGCTRLRVGDYRVLFRALPDQIVILRIRHRAEVLSLSPRPPALCTRSVTLEVPGIVQTFSATQASFHMEPEH
jgi:mRNA-degrading endonuclease RelE of RelBE toxin-antitoxin system